MLKVVHYINQFFGQIGGEDKADTPPLVKEGPVGPGLALQQALGDQGKVVATIICGDSYFNEHVDEALGEILRMVEQYQPDLFVAGPAFFAGRYGIACATVCKAVQEKFGIPVVTGMYPENPGVDLCKKDVYVIKTGDSAAQMKDAITKMVKLALKMVNKEEIGTPEEEGYIPRGIRKNYFAQERASKRAVDVLVKKLKGEPYTTELPMPEFDRVPPAPAVKDLSKALVALVTSGGIVPKGNPDHIESSSASKFGKYDLEGIEALSSETHQTAHGGYDPVYANEDPNRVLPVDVMRELEKEGKIGKLHRYYYATVGNGTPVAKAQQYGQAIAKELKDAGVQAVILTST